MNVTNGYNLKRHLMAEQRFVFPRVIDDPASVYLPTEFPQTPQQIELITCIRFDSGSTQHAIDPAMSKYKIRG